MSVGKSTTGAYYSLDAYSWLENYALEHSGSPEDILLEREEMTTRLYLNCSFAGGSGSCHSEPCICGFQA